MLRGGSHEPRTNGAACAQRNPGDHGCSHRAAVPAGSLLQGLPDANCHQRGHAQKETRRAVQEARGPGHQGVRSHFAQGVRQGTRGELPDRDVREAGVRRHHRIRRGAGARSRVAPEAQHVHLPRGIVNVLGFFFIWVFEEVE